MGAPLSLLRMKGEKDGDDSDSSSSSDDSSSSDSVNEEELHTKINGDCYVKHTSERCFQNRKTKMLHRPGKSVGLLLCGRRCNDNYRELKDGASFHWPRCTGCFRGDVLTTAEQLVEAFDKVRAGHVPVNPNVTDFSMSWNASMDLHLF